MLDIRRLNIYHITYAILRTEVMGHTVKEKSKLLNRVRRLRGQVEAIERALEAEAGCAEVMQLVVDNLRAMIG
jgi:hypothetical protein